MNFFKKVDLIDEMEKHINEEEDIFVECFPNKIPFVIQKMWQAFIIIFATIFIDFIYALMRSVLTYEIANLIDISLIMINMLGFAFFFYKLYCSILNANNSYYVITTTGVHIINCNKSINYSNYIFEDMQNMVLDKKIIKTGNIYIQEKNMKIPSSLIDKFLMENTGLIAIDEAEKVFEVLKQLAIQANENIFFFDGKNDSSELAYQKDVKKYSKKIEVKKDDSLISRRNS